MCNTHPNNVPIRMFNPTLKSITVRRKAAIGTVSPVVACEVVQDHGGTDKNGANGVTVPSHLQDLYEASIKELPADQHAKFAKLLIEYKEFSRPEMEILVGLEQ